MANYIFKYPSLSVHTYDKNALWTGIVNLSHHIMTHIVNSCTDEDYAPDSADRKWFLGKYMSVEITCYEAFIDIAFRDVMRSETSIIPQADLVFSIPYMDLHLHMTNKVVLSNEDFEFEMNKLRKSLNMVWSFMHIVNANDEKVNLKQGQEDKEACFGYDDNSFEWEEEADW